jgi:hypothetical protein
MLELWKPKLKSESILLNIKTKRPSQIRLPENKKYIFSFRQAGLKTVQLLL